jgi:hypothetical protein
MQPESATWYMGPAGNLRALQTPQGGMDFSEVRYGGVFQGLSGARTMDVTGHRSAVNMEWTYMTKSDWDFLNACHTRQLPGPHYLINPLSKNRLSVQAARGDYVRNTGTGTGIGVWTESAVPVWQNNVFPANVLGSRSSRVAVYLFPTAINFMFDRGVRTPILPLEQVTGSVYLKADGATTGFLTFRNYDVNGNALATTVGSTINLTTSWQRFSITQTAPVGSVAVTFEYVINNDSQAHNMAAPQVESGAVATAWELGGGSLRVLVDQLTTTSPRYPLQDASLALLEA